MNSHQTLLAMLAVDGGYHELRNSELETVCWIPCDAPFDRSARRMARSYDRMSLAPKNEPGSTFSPRAHALWAKTFSRRSLELLRRVKPWPTLVLREGHTCRYTAFWAMDDRMDYDRAYELNRRLAHRLSTPKKCGDPEGYFDLPSKTVAVVHYQPAIYDQREICRVLPALPEKVDWRDRERVGYLGTEAVRNA